MTMTGRNLFLVELNGLLLIREMLYFLRATRFVVYHRGTRNLYRFLLPPIHLPQHQRNRRPAHYLRFSTSTMISPPLSSVDDDGNDSSFQVSFEELDDIIESDAENPVDSMGKYENMYSAPKYIVFEDELLKLFKLCAICGEDVLEKGLVKRGSALKVTTLCKNSHTHEWNSQAQVKRAAAGNLLLSRAILFTGNTFSRASEMASIVNLAFPGESDYLQYQNKHLLPVINERWQQEKASVLTDLLDRESVTLLGDGRCDSPGYSAKYGTYTLMDEETKKIVDFEVSHVKQTTSSQAMEKRGFHTWLKCFLLCWSQGPQVKNQSQLQCLTYRRISLPYPVHPKRSCKHATHQDLEKTI